MSRMIDFCDIACDVCVQWVPGQSPSTNAQRKVLRRRGWSVRNSLTGMQDICPACNGTDPGYWRKLRLDEEGP